MAANPDLMAVLTGLPATVFALWPVILIGTLIGWGFEDLRPLVVVWVALLLVWLLARWLMVAPLFPLIPEPYNYTIFIVLGAALVLVSVFRGEQGE